MSNVIVSDNAADTRFVATVDGKPAGYIDYSLPGRGMLIRHTEVDASYEGQGVGAALARFALDSARERGVQVIPICPFVAGWILRHPEYADLVVESMRAQFERR